MVFEKSETPHPQVGWMGIRPGRREELIEMKEVNIDFQEGIIGDHYSKKRGKRQITLISKSALENIASALGINALDPKFTRRNIVVEGNHPHYEKGDILSMGEEVKLEITGPCPPCSRMQENLGDIGFKAMTGKGGWIARVVEGGRVAVGEKISVNQDQTSSL